MNQSRGYTLVELVVAVGLFALIMTLASGAYLIMINLNRQAQGVSTGINSLSFALESMTRSIRTGTNYSCNGVGDCIYGANNIRFRNSVGDSITYFYSTNASACGGSNNGCIMETIHRASTPVGFIGSIDTTSPVTDPSVHISALTFYVSGSRSASSASPNDPRQPYVTMIVAGTIATGSGRQQDFVVETGAAMRGTDL